MDLNSLLSARTQVTLKSRVQISSIVAPVLFLRHLEIPVETDPADQPTGSAGHIQRTRRRLRVIFELTVSFGSLQIQAFLSIMSHHRRKVMPGLFILSSGLSLYMKRAFRITRFNLKVVSSETGLVPHRNAATRQRGRPL